MPWDYTKEEYEKQAKADPVWHLNHVINGDVVGEKLNKEDVKRYWNDLKMPDDRRAFLELLLWNKSF